MSRRPLRVIMAPDSYKGSLSAVDAAHHLREGWLSVRGSDVVTTLPQADGGEGTVDAFSAGRVGGVRHTELVHGPDGRPVTATWLELADGTAVVELAESSGLPLLAVPDPLGASTRGLGEVIRAAIRHGALRLVVGLGGSASTDGGSGALAALGARLLDDRGQSLSDGGGGLVGLARLEVSGMIDPPPGGVVLLHDTSAPLLGHAGAARTFGPQKGADAKTCDLLERAMERWSHMLSEVWDVRPDQPGAGAAGGTGFGLSAWGGKLASGADAVAEMTGLNRALSEADVVVTGEGRFDRTSRAGKLVGNLMDRAQREGTGAIVIAGSIGAPTPGMTAFDLTEIAGSPAAAMSEPGYWLQVAAARAAATVLPGGLAPADDPDHPGT